MAWLKAPVFAVFVISLLGCNSSREVVGESEVLAAYTCPEERCVRVEDAVAALGRAFLEPAVLPEGFSLYSRSLVADPPNLGAKPGEASYTVFEDFRFQDSQNVPGVVLIQTWPFQGSQARIQTESESCGPLQHSAHGPIYYAEGLVRVLPVSEEGLWLVCLDQSAGHEDTHYVVAATNGGLVEIIAFPESGVTKDELLALVESLLPVSTSPD